MVFNYTDKQLNELNHGKNVYSVNSEYAERHNKPLVTEAPNPNPLLHLILKKPTQ